ncbi:hypothetical protein AB0451_25190 [Streptomyces sp. NPDC052000]|uniref:hypothetical protein n=1 Tax=Streptomyces sp. NPDC052000 TaxID=3155676 RepID=UPI0034510465
MASLLVLGVWMSTGRSRRDRPGARRNGSFLILISLSSLASQLPHKLGWSHSIALALDPVALLLAVAGLVVVLTGPWRKRRGKQQVSG